MIRREIGVLRDSQIFRYNYRFICLVAFRAAVRDWNVDTAPRRKRRPNLIEKEDLYRRYEKTACNSEFVPQCEYEQISAVVI